MALNYDDNDADNEHDAEDCDDDSCDEHYQTFHVTLTREVTFTVRAKDNDDAMDAAQSTVQFEVIQAPDLYADEFDEGSDDYSVESEAERLQHEIDRRRFAAEYLAEMEAEASK